LSRKKEILATLISVLVFVILLPAGLVAHVFPDHSSPRVGSTITKTPKSVKIWFDGELEPLFSTLKVTDAQGTRVDSSNAHVDTSDHTLLQVGLHPLQPGVYRVSWIAVSRDGHRTNGDYSFTLVKPGKQ
jgi:methionine-rich copper-binding protein CopC